MKELLSEEEYDSFLEKFCQRQLGSESFESENNKKLFNNYYKKYNRINKNLFTPSVLIQNMIAEEMQVHKEYIVGGNPDAGNGTFWFDNAQTIDKKIKDKEKELDSITIEIWEVDGLRDDMDESEQYDLISAALDEKRQPTYEELQELEKELAELPKKVQEILNGLLNLQLRLREYIKNGNWL